MYDGSNSFLLENTENVPTNGMDEGMTKSQRVRMNYVVVRMYNRRNQVTNN